MCVSIKNIYECTKWSEDQTYIPPIMTMAVQAAQNLYNESLGCDVLESCPVFKTK